jgi:F420-dependent oxidoreductase-like protein
MNIGLQIPNFTFGTPDDQLFDQVLERATAAEESGLDSVWVMDHFYQLPALGGPSQPMLEAYTLLGAIGARTRRVKLGTLVTGVTYRNPALLAKTVTTLDVITGGRAILGIGAAWYDVEHDGLGVDYPSDGDRLDRLEEAVQICRAMFRDERPSFSGRYYRTDDAWNVPRPIQLGGPPILIGGGGEKRTLRLVARYADFCNFIGDVATVRRKVDILRQHCASEGRDPADVTVSRLSTLVITDSHDETVATRDFLRQATGEESGFNVGTEEEILEQVDELRSAGVDYFIFNMPVSGPDAVRRLGEMFAGRPAD